MDRQPVEEDAQLAPIEEDTQSLPIPTTGHSSDSDPARKRSWHRRPLTLLAVAVVLVAGLTVAVVSLVSTGGAAAAPAWIQRLTGTIVAQGLDGVPVTSAPDGAHQRRYATLRGFSSEVAFAAAPDGHLLASTSGLGSSSPPRYWSFITVDGETLKPYSTRLGDLQAPALPQPSPFADHDQAIVVVKRGYPTSKSTAAMVTLTSGQTVQLGSVDAAAGDPQSLGAFVSVPVSGDPNFLAGSADGSIQLRVAERPPVTLATAGQLNQDVGQLPSTPVDLAVYPDPDGNQLAVLLNPLGASTSNVPMVVLDRQGRVLSTVVEGAGPTAGTQPAWSPNGRMLAYLTSTSTGPALAIQTTNGQPQTYQASNPNTQLESCIWSPTATAAVCLARLASRTEWDFANTTTGTLDSVTSLGYPIAWVQSGGITARS